jgi:predicted O-linked N-acetylglucosamine transferase (SPINDLY family)
MARQAPTGADRGLQLAAAQLARGDLAAAENTLVRLLRGQPRLAAAHHLLSIVANTAGRSEQAVACARAAIAIVPGRAEFHFALGRALKAAQQLEEAVGAYRQALLLQPDYVDALVSLGIALRLLGRLDEAIACQRRALASRPEYPPALTNLGNALAERIGREVGGNVTAEDLRDAEHVQRRALALEPRNPHHLHNLALLLKLTGRYDESAELLNRGLASDPSRVDTCVQFGDLLMSQMRFDLAVALYSRWLGDNPPDTRVMLGLASCLNELGRSDEAVAWLDRVIEMEPDSVPALYIRGRIEQRRFDSSFDSRAALAVYKAAIEARPDYFEAICSYLMTLCYVEQDPVVLAAEHRARIAPMAPREPAPRPPMRARAGCRLRIGYVSLDYKRHSVAYFLENILEAHDRTCFDVHAYKLNVGGDAVTDRLKSLSEHWIECGHLGDEQLAAQVRADGIDVLIDLSGLSSGTRLGLFERRPAPCQITYLGYPTSTGAGCFDFRISDAVIDPDNEPQHGSEPVLRCRPTMFCYRPGLAPDVAPVPAAQRGQVTFGSFNNLSKVSSHTLALWRRLLQAVPHSRLLLKSQAFQQRGNREFFVRYFAEHGVVAERLQLQPLLPDVQAHLATYGEVDIALDCFPFNGATTSCEALYMGVPVVSLAGQTHPSRMGASILGACDLAELVAHDDEGYLATAAALAADLPRLAALRAGMRERLHASRLLDKLAFTRDFESLLDEACRRVASARDEQTA